MEIKFKRDTAFRKTFFVPDSFAHPAKMDAQLLLWIVQRYSVVGETILDPMAGSGTMMLACTLGRNVVLVELEEKFCKMMRDNWEQVKMRPQLGSTMGSCQIIQGDARQLEGLVDKIVTSPPYAETEATQRLPNIPTSKGGQTKYEPQSAEGNIGNLPYGEIDKCIFSLPYAGGEQFHDLDWIAKNKDAPHRSKQKQGMSNLPYGQIDKIVTSPPYSEEIGHSGKDDYPIFQEKGLSLRGSKRYGDLTNENIGNLKSDSYLEAMLQVYQSCFAVLRDGGLMVLVTKNFIRNKQVVRLDEDTITLCEQAGFSFVERHYRELPSQSFWRVIYHQKFPDVEQIKSEDVLVFRK